MTWGYGLPFTFFSLASAVTGENGTSVSSESELESTSTEEI